MVGVGNNQGATDVQGWTYRDYLPESLKALIQLASQSGQSKSRAANA